MNDGFALVKNANPASESTDGWTDAFALLTSGNSSCIVLPTRSALERWIFKWNY
jgi:hypothetical protein